GKIMRSYPLVAGIDVAGRIETSTNARFKPGDAVLVTGSGIGERSDGGFAGRVRVAAEHVIAIPEGLDRRSAMQLGTAGFTATLAIHRMELNGQAPANGPILVTGASGGVGSLATAMLAGLGYEVLAMSGKTAAIEWLKALGASEIIASRSAEF